MLLELLLVGGLHTHRLMAIFWLIGSLVMGYFAVATLRGIRFANKMEHAGIQTAGLIISQREVQRGGRGNFETYLIPKVRYQTLAGKTLEGESIGGGEVEFYDGQEAYLLYDADEPTSFLFVQEINQTQTFINLALLLVAALFSVFGIWVAIDLLAT